MQRTTLLMLAALAVLACQRGAGTSSGATGSAGDAAPSKATLVFASSIAGQLVPCGCSPDQLGGLPRAVALIRKLRAAEPGLVFIDAGDLLFSGTPGAQAVEQHELKARTLARGEALMGAAARAVGARDLARGGDFVAQTASGVPLLDGSGLPTPGTRPGLVVKAGPLSVGLFAAGLDGLDKPIAERAKALRAQGAQLVVMLYQPKPGAGPSVVRARAAASAAKAAGVDLIVLGKRDDLTEPNIAEAEPVPLVAPQGHFQQLLRLDLRLPAGGAGPLFLSRGQAGKSEALQRFDDRIARLREQAASAEPERKKLYESKIAEQQKLRAEASAQVEQAPAGAIVAAATFLPLDAKVGSDPEAEALVAEYDAAVARINLAAAQKQPEACPPADKGEPFYIGMTVVPPGAVQTCAGCHPIQAEFWKNTRHAHAWHTLVKAKKQFSLDCVQCHVTGWQQPGGVCRIDRTHVGGPGLKVHGELAALGRQDVQCEACHGPASEHVKEPPGNIKLAVSKNDCMRCHEAANSPHFDYDKYLPGVVGPGHGKPLAEGQKPGPVWVKPQTGMKPAEGRP